MNERTKLVALRSLLTLLTLSVVCFIFSQSIMPATESSAESGRVVAFLNSVCEKLGLGELFTQDFVRTCAHLAEFAILGVMMFITVSLYSQRTSVRLSVTVGAFVLVALTDECIQLFADGRAFQFSDILIDTIGGTIGMLFVYLICALTNRRRKREKRVRGNRISYGRKET